MTGLTRGATAMLGIVGLGMDLGCRDVVGRGLEKEFARLGDAEKCWVNGSVLRAWWCGGDGGWERGWRAVVRWREGAIVGVGLDGSGMGESSVKESSVQIENRDEYLVLTMFCL